MPKHTCQCMYTCLEKGGGEVVEERDREQERGRTKSGPFRCPCVCVGGWCPLDRASSSMFPNSRDL